MARGLGRSCEVCVLEMYTWEGLTSLETLPALNLDLLKTRAKTRLVCPLLSTPPQACLIPHYTSLLTVWGRTLSCVCQKDLWERFRSIEPQG